MNILLVMNGKNCTVPPIGYGGTQRKIYWHAKELFRLGHNVWVAADPNSKIFQENPKIKCIPYPFDEQKIDEIIPEEIDIVHYFKPPKKMPKKPFIFTEGCNGLPNHEYCPNTVFVSKSHAKNHNAKEFVYGGVPPEEYLYSDQKNNSILYLALLNWLAKNAQTAINLSLDTNTPLTLCGGNLNTAWKVWTLPMIYQFLKFKNLTSLVGMIDGEQKLQLLKQSGLLFYIINWQEPCANATHESFASGTPIIASRCGFLEEYIVHKENGYLVDSYQQAVECINYHFSLPIGRKIEMSQDAFRSLKTIEIMTKVYLEKYEIIIKNRYLYPPKMAKTFKFTAPKIDPIIKKSDPFSILRVFLDSFQNKNG